MKFIMIGLIAVVGYVVGVFGFSQIIGSLQNYRARRITATLFTITIWVLVFVGEIFLVHKFFLPYRYVFYSTSGIALIQVFFSGRIK